MTRNALVPTTRTSFVFLYIRPLSSLPLHMYFVYLASLSLPLKITLNAFSYVAM